MICRKITTVYRERIQRKKWYDMQITTAYKERLYTHMSTSQRKVKNTDVMITGVYPLLI